MTLEINAKSRVTVEDGKVFIRIPQADVFLQLSPESAERLGASLFVRAAEAEGRVAPRFVTLLGGEDDE